MSLKRARPKIGAQFQPRTESRPTGSGPKRRQSEAARRTGEAERERIRRMSPLERALLALDLGERLSGLAKPRR